MNKWLKRVLWTVGVLLLLIVAFVAYAMASALKTERPVGFQTTQTNNAKAQPFAIAIWYPTQTSPWPTAFAGTGLMSVAKNAPISGGNLPLVVISHGNGGGSLSHVDLALALANAGYVVVAPMHSGDNYADQQLAGSVELFTSRANEVKASVDYMLNTWSGHDAIDPERVGAFGFSAGGFTILTAIGAQPEMRLIAKHCAEKPEFVCDVLEHFHSPLLNADAAIAAQVFTPDTRIKTAVLAAPGLGFTLLPSGLTKVDVPIQLWIGEKDDKVPDATNTKPLRDFLGTSVEFHSVADANHFSFLAPCNLLKPPGLCADPDAFNRAAFHQEMNASVVTFFNKTLK